MKCSALVITFVVFLGAASVPAAAEERTITDAMKVQWIR
jgi:hypothetical protein